MVQALSVILAILGLVAFIWIVVGGIPGMVFLVLTIITKEKEKRRRYLKFMLISFGGIGLLVVVFILYALLGVFGFSTGAIPFNNPLPTYGP